MRPPGLDAETATTVAATLGGMAGPAAGCPQRTPPDGAEAFELLDRDGGSGCTMALGAVGGIGSDGEPRRMPEQLGSVLPAEPPPSMCSFVVQTFPSLLLAGFGMVGAGILLDVVQHWPLFVEVSELFILVPALLGLKGNLEMTLASRLSTAATLPAWGDVAKRRQLLAGNLCLIQVQALLVALAASVFSVALGVLFHNEFSASHTALLLADSMLTASIASLVLG